VKAAAKPSKVVPVIV
jgi:bloom syndrome protein